MRYTEGFKKSLVRRLLLPDAPSVAQLSEETNVSIQTLYKWLRDLKDSVEMADYKKTPEEWTLSEKNAALLEVASLSPEEEGEWLRRNGLHSEHLTQWKEEIQETLIDVSRPVSKEEQKELKQKNKELQKELRKKDKALAEMTVLMTLKKSCLTCSTTRINE